MRSKMVFFAGIVLVLGAGISCRSSETKAGNAGGSSVGKERGQEEVYLFSFFKDQRSGLRLAYSEDLYHWREIGGVHLLPRVGDKIMRDPFLERGPDGMFHLTWTTGWGRRDIGYASSADLVHWSEEKLIPVMGDKAGVRNCWAPKLFYDEGRGQWMILWSTWLDDGSFPAPEEPATSKQNRIFYVTTKDFKSFSEAKLLFDPGYSCIDAYLLKDGDEYLLFFKDERGNNAEEYHAGWQNIRFARGRSVYGPFGGVSGTITGKGKGKWHNEGPSVIKAGGEYYVFYDHHSGRAYYGAVKSSNLSKWEDVSEQMRFPADAKHGHIIRVPRGIVEGLLLKAAGSGGGSEASARANDEKGSFRFTVTGDPRSSLSRWRWTLRQMKEKVGDEGAFHITAGDYFEVDRSTEAADYYNFLRAEFGEDVVWYPTVGNHELKDGQTDLAWLRRYYYEHLKGKVNPGPAGCEETTYSWDYGIAHFVQLDMYYDGSKHSTEGSFNDLLYNWLVKDLDKNTKPVVFVIYHEPAFPNGRGGKKSPAGWRRFMKLLNERKVVAGLCAHTHKYARYQVDGAWEKFTWEVDAGNAGRMSHADRHQTFIDVTVYSDGRVKFDTWQGVEGSGFRVRDSWVVEAGAKGVSEAGEKVILLNK